MRFFSFSVKTAFLSLETMLFIDSSRDGDDGSDNFLDVSGCFLDQELISYCYSYCYSCY